MVKYFLTNITKHFFPIIYYAIGYKLSKIMIYILKSCSEYDFRYIGFGKTLLSINQFNTFNYTDDDNDFVVFSKNGLDQQLFYLFFIKKLFMYNLKVHVYLAETKVTSVDINDFIVLDLYPNSREFSQYCSYCNTCISFNDLELLINNGYEIKLINFSPSYERVVKMYHKYFGTKNIPKKLYQFNKYVKIPWIDVFYGKIDSTNNLSIPSFGKKQLPIGNLRMQKLYDLDVYEPEDLYLFLKKVYQDRFAKELRESITNHKTIDEYIDYNYIDNYFIRECHGKNKNAQLFRINNNDPVQKSILIQINKTMTKYITDYCNNVKIIF